MLSQTNVNSIFDMFDANGDGFIDLDELKAVFQNRLEFGDSQICDLDNESAILEMVPSPSEKSTTEARMSCEEEESIWKMILDAADTDKDGKISKKEF
jgi:Ca2+-binding EF-hand superfamily protein